MCGPSDLQNQLAGQSSSFSKLLGSNYASRFGAQSQVLQNLNNIFTPIAEAGPDQMGFGPQELAALRTQAATGTGQSYAKGLQALQTGLSARGGGAEFLPTGGEAVLRGGLAAAGAQQMSQEQLGITEAGYQAGRQQWQQATGGLESLARQYDPGAIAGETTAATGQAYGEAQQNAMQGIQQFGDIAGGIAGLGKSAGEVMSGYGALTKAASSGGGG